MSSNITLMNIINMRPETKKLWNLYLKDLKKYPLEETRYKINDYTVFIRRDQYGGNNGYIVLPYKHKFEELEDYQIELNVHGGITYKEEEKCYGWVIGFDTSHVGDFVPKAINCHGSHFWTHEEVLAELKKVVEQLY